MSTTTTASAASTASTTAVPIGLWARRTLRFALSLLVAAGASWIVYGALPGRLDVHTDIVGFPIHGNYLPERLLYVYAVIVVVGPAVALGIYVLLGRVVPWFTAPSSRVLRVPLAATPSPVRDWSLRTAAAAWARLLLVGAVLGLEATTVVDDRRSVAFVATVVVQVSVVTVGGWLIARWRASSRAAGRSLMNALVAPAGFLGLWLVSRHTTVTVVESGAVHRYQWMPLWLATIGTALMVGVILWFGRRLGHQEYGRIERWTLLLLVGPLVIFLLMGGLPGEVGLFNSFEEGQLLGGAQFLIDGLVPWRDVLLTHGVLQDQLVFLPGLLIFGESRWGASAGEHLLVLPVAWIGGYYLAVYLFRRNWVFLVATVGLVAVGASFLGGLFATPLVRFALLPYVLLLFAAVLHKPSWPRAAAFVVVLLVQVALAPELAPAIPVFAVTLFVFEVLGRSPGEPLGSSFPRIARCAVATGGFAVAWAVFLASIGALNQFVEYFTTFVGSHLLTGALPLLDDGTDEYVLLSVLPIALVLVSIWYFVAQVRADRRMGVAEWTMIAAAALLAVYYSKFLARPDGGHARQVFAVAVPLALYVAYRTLEAIERLALRSRVGERSARFVGPHWITAVVVLAIFVPSVDALWDRGRMAPGAFRPAVGSEPWDPRNGYGPSSGEGRATSDIRQVLDAIEGRDGGVWDFSNAIGTFSFLMHEPLVTRYPHVSMAQQKSTQADLIDDLRHERPGVIVYDSYTGLVNWDGVPNQVRHYDVSEYILRHYRPFVGIDGYLLYVRDDLRPSRSAIEQLPLASTPKFDDLYFAPGRCDWGTTAYFFDQSPSRGAASVDVDTSDGPTFTQATGWVPVSIDGREVLGVVAVADGEVIARGSLERSRIDLPPTVDGRLKVNFGIAAPSTNLALYARLDDDSIVRIDPTGHQALEAWPSSPSVSEGGQALTVRDGVAGEVEQSLPKHSFRFQLPPDADTYGWLRLVAPQSFEPDVFEISDNGSPGRAVAFRTLRDRGDDYLVKIGSCSDWRGLASGNEALVLHDNEQPTPEVELIK